VSSSPSHRPRAYLPLSWPKHGHDLLYVGGEFRRLAKARRVPLWCHGPAPLGEKPLPHKPRQNGNAHELLRAVEQLAEFGHGHAEAGAKRALQPVIDLLAKTRMGLNDRNRYVFESRKHPKDGGSKGISRQQA
jgi:hypothetical protein